MLEEPDVISAGLRVSPGVRGGLKKKFILQTPRSGDEDSRNTDTKLMQNCLFSPVPYDLALYICHFQSCIRSS
jgi:hypothetical protein